MSYERAADGEIAAWVYPAEWTPEGDQNGGRSLPVCETHALPRQMEQAYDSMPMRGCMISIKPGGTAEYILSQRF